MNYFYTDIKNNIQVSWNELLNDLNNLKVFNPYSYHADFYTTFKQIIFSILIGEDIVLIDSDFSDHELKKLTGQTDLRSFSKPLEESSVPQIYCKEDLLTHLKHPRKNWSLTLFTSGTTGQPKKVKHSFKTLTRSIKISTKNSSDIWGFAYNPAHMAGIQVFLQALLNGNLIVKLFGLSNEVIFDSISKYNITHISATPTFYRLLFPTQRSYYSVIQITSGGEKLDENIFQQLKNLFPNAKITNIYASTEAGTLFASNGTDFYLKKEMEQLVRFEENEILIHKSMVGSFDNIIGDWYHTGDIVEIVSQNPLQFRFINRKNEIINVGGYKVHPSEVEDAIRKIEGVIDVRVFAKKNSVLGNIVCCEIVNTNELLNDTTLRAYLKSHLQEYKIPRMIKFVTNISTTRSGKIKRN